MEQILKAAEIAKQEGSSEDLALINKQALREMTQEEVFIFRMAACDNQVDRDYERFTDAALEGLAAKFVGKTVLMDHAWSAGSQTARVYDAHVEEVGEIKRLILRCYMPRTEKTADTITAIESGILKECSVGCAMGKATCSICGADQTKTICNHWPGREYEGQLCVVDLDEPKDVYEVSLVAVPAQPEAGVVKSKRYGGTPEPPPPPQGPEPGEESKSMMEKLAAMAAGHQE